MVLDLIVEKVASLDDHGFSFLCLQPMEGVSLTLRRAHRVEVGELSTLVVDASHVRIDATHPPAPLMTPIWEALNRPNLMVEPIVVRNRLIGVLGVGNRLPQFQWSHDWIDLIAVFVKQTTIALKNDLLLRKTRALSIRDELTGVYNEAYVRQRLAEELKRALRYQRPCALAMFAIRDLAAVRQDRGDAEAERVLKQVARLLQDSVTDIDRVGRFAGDELVVVLPERSKRQATALVEEIQRQIVLAVTAASHAAPRIEVVGSVAENPLDGVTAEALIQKATASLQDLTLHTSGSGA